MLQYSCYFLFIFFIAAAATSIQTVLEKTDDPFVYYDLTKFVNNKGAGEGGSLDRLGNHFVCDAVIQRQPQQDVLDVGGMRFRLTRDTKGHDNARGQGQVITLDRHLGGLYLLVSVSHGPLTTQVVVTHQDGQQVSTTLQLPDWQVNQDTRHATMECRVSTGARGWLMAVPVYLDPSRPVSHLTLPYADNLHVFGLTGLVGTPVKVTTIDGGRQLVVHNTGPEWLRVHVRVSIGRLVETLQPGTVGRRLAPGMRRMVDGLRVRTLFRERKPRWVQVDVIQDDKLIGRESVLMLLGEPSPESLGEHRAPAWYQQAKFGIFIHWGVYAVPAWAPPYQYAEWYWYQLNQIGGPTYYHHLNTYGPQLNYDDFIDHWDPAAFDPEAWLDLVNTSRARYFVFTSKHHDGLALFDTKVTGRSTVQFKGRDFVAELYRAAKEIYPHLKRGIYFSLPEWYHPDYHDNTFLWWHGPPHNPFTGQEIEYRKSKRVADFVNEIQVPQALELIHQYEPDIFWCDIGGINNSSAWQTEFFGRAQSRGQEVVVNDRCGNGVSDFATIEYRQVSVPPPRPWESTRGIDPFSFGYNKDTPLEAYTSTTDLIREFVHVVANGGNWLLNIGPQASGRVPPVMIDRLSKIGAWLDVVGESIFDAEPYWVTPLDTKEPGQSLRFTVNRDGTSIYLFSLYRPTRRLVVKAPIPHARDRQSTRITYLGSQSVDLEWDVYNNGRFVIHIPDAIIERDEYVWVFKVESLLLR